MEHALLTVIAAVIGGGVCGAVVISWNMLLRLRRLERHVLSERNVGAARARWSQDDELLKAMQQTKVSKTEKYANDFE